MASVLEFHPGGKLLVDVAGPRLAPMRGGIVLKNRTRIPVFMRILMFFMLLAAAPVWLSAQGPDVSTFSLSPGDITEAIVKTSGQARLKVMLTPAKARVPLPSSTSKRKAGFPLSRE